MQGIAARMLLVLFLFLLAVFAAGFAQTNPVTAMFSTYA